MTRTILMNSWKMVDGLRLAPRMPTIPKRSILLNHYQCLEFITLFLPRRTTYYLFSVDSVWTISSSENNSFIVDIYVNDSKEQQKKRLHFKNHKSNCHTNRSGQKKKWASQLQCSNWEHDKNFIVTKRHLYINQDIRNVLGISIGFRVL